MESQEQVKKILGEIPVEFLKYDEEQAKSYSETYSYVEQYAEKKELFCTSIALPLVRGIMSHGERTMAVRSSDKARYMAYLRHCLAVCSMLIDLQFPLEKQEEDFMLAAAICHILPENETVITFDNLKDKMIGKYHLAGEVVNIVQLITRADGMSDVQQKEFYKRIQENKLATLVRLADRGNLVQQLYGVDIWSARAYIHETKEYFFPLCIYAKEHYPELMGPISVMMEKMRCHIEVSEIMLNRFEAKEQQLMQEILMLKEDNSRIRGIIKQLKEA